MRVEERRFHWEDPAGRAHFAEHGYAILSGIFDEVERSEVRSGWDEVVGEAAVICNVSPTRFVERFPQNRDLWLKSSRFHRLLFDSKQADVARLYLGVSGVRLFHDHAIAKPAASSERIPWHQDSAYWPVDRVGLSLWTPVEAVPEDGGCLEVLDGSHRDGPAEPQDFLRGDGAPPEGDPRRVRLPVREGETVVLNGLTWHGSEPNRAAHDRLAYLTLWVPATARFVPEHAGWHPAAAHITSAPGQRIDGEQMPLFGVLANEDEGQHVVFPSPEKRRGPSMFTASRDIADQIAWLLGAPPSPLAKLLEGDGIAVVVRAAVASGLCPQASGEDLHDVLEGLLLQERVRRVSVARDVYLRCVSRWWSLIGARVEEACHAR